MTNNQIRNVAIIAHVDHGKTTLVDALFQTAGLFRENQQTEERIMDSMDLERERGITISAKNCSIAWKDVKINILDTPGHADFGGEVERALSMVNGAILLVDASEGPLPQTRFVLKKALDQGLPLIAVINKIDRQDARPLEVLDEIYSLLIDLDAHEDQLEFPVFYAVGRDGVAKTSLNDEDQGLEIVLDSLVKTFPGHHYQDDAPLQMLVSDLSYNEYLGRLCVGKIHNGVLHSGDNLVCLDIDGKANPLKVSKLQVYQGIGLSDLDTAEPGEIVVLSGIEDVRIGDTVCTREHPVSLPRIKVDEPTVSMRFMKNTGPYAGQDGKHVQPTKLWARLEREALKNVSLQVERIRDKDGFNVKGRGEFQLAILTETMRREGYEFCVGRPEVIFKKDEKGRKLEPVEHLFIDCQEEFMGIVTEKLSSRKCRMITMSNHGSGRVRLEFSAPSRALIGYRDEFLTDTKGTGILNSSFLGYEEYRGDIRSGKSGSLVSDRQGESVPYALFNLEPRGRLFIVPKTKVYEGMIIGEHNREGDLDVNPVKEKKLTNVRASGRDDNVILTPVVPLTLEQCLNYLGNDELLEVTPNALRLRKEDLSAQSRKVSAKKKKFS
ncbi:translational GTPase TypA [Salinispira pacifica]|uniref:Large ribosomal subunit assembly factor BipA n=1 Tax=Salinispira pacifica TaxID=1307761 RepID=V5WHA1_9SPIO|nr:translational GTPase TypA [Salinispira pacifica]AHC15178.1 GTP-binding protein TypA/BipA [Salinispira pacifica]